MSEFAAISIENRFQDQVAIVTGAATGLGEAIARRLAMEGAKVALLDRDGERLQQTTAALERAGLSVRGFQVDITDEATVGLVVANVERDLGPLTVLINSAGIVGPTNTRIIDYPIEQFDRVYSVNLRGSFVMTKAVLPSMQKRGYGRILLIASIAGKEGNPGMVGYSASKAGVIGLVKSVGKEFAETGITINGLAPAVVMTDLVRGVDPKQVEYMTAKIPMKRLGTVEEVASLSAWIVSRECSFTTGFIFDLSGGRATY
jgi:NAD(P)-dependent dehydrogenase (short-subunit alcohol dehydrogenase family)